MLAEHNIGALVVVDPGLRPVGILSERDIVRAAVRDESVFGLTVSQLMTRDVIVGVPGDDLAVGRPHDDPSGTSAICPWSRAASSSAWSRSATS